MTARPDAQLTDQSLSTNKAYMQLGLYEICLRVTISKLRTGPITDGPQLHTGIVALILCATVKVFPQIEQLP